jgi:hypothetical protein
MDLPGHAVEDYAVLADLLDAGDLVLLHAVGDFVQALADAALGGDARGRAGEVAGVGGL